MIIRIVAKILNKTLESALLYFQDSEEYRKCAHIFKIQQIIRGALEIGVEAKTRLHIESEIIENDGLGMLQSVTGRIWRYRRTNHLYRGFRRVNRQLAIFPDQRQLTTIYFARDPRQNIGS